MRRIARYGGGRAEKLERDGFHSRELVSDRFQALAIVGERGPDLCQSRHILGFVSVPKAVDALLSVGGWRCHHHRLNRNRQRLCLDIPALSLSRESVLCG